MLLCDTHADTLYSMAYGKEDTDITIDALREGDYTRVQAFALFTGSDGLRGKDEGVVDKMLACFEKLKARGLRQIRSISEAEKGEANAILTVEGGEVFERDIETVDEHWQLGVRIAAIVWNNENRLAFPAKHGSERGLTQYGRRVVRRMIEKGIAIDISHLNARGVMDVYDTGAPYMASHSCCRALCDNTRNLTDEQIKRIIERGGYIGVNFYVPFLTDKGRADIDTVIDHIDHICELGGEKHVGFGSDFDGIDEYPEGLRTARDLPKILGMLNMRGYSQGQVEDIAGENLRRFLDQFPQGQV